MATMKVYIEDHTSGDLIIGDCPCRRLGVLRNGETATFQIPDEAAKVYVIADKLSRNFSNEYYPLPEGQEDIVLSGKCAYNPTAGNPFRFNGVTDENVLQNRKKGGRKSLVIMILAVLIGLGVGFWMNMPKEKTFSNNGIEITLTSDFEKEDFSGFDAGYISDDVMVLLLKEHFSMLEGSKNMSVDEYAQLVNENNGNKGTVKKENGVVYFEYSAVSDGKKYHYVVTMHKGPDAFWLVQFCTLETDKDTFRDRIFKWAASVDFEIAG